MKTTHLTGSLLENKCTTHNFVVTEEKSDNTGAMLEHLPQKRLRELAQLAQVSTVTSATLRQIRVTEDGN